VFRSLNLKQQNERGQPTWELTSPEARYDIRRRVAQARSPQGVIYVAGKPIYRLQATSGTVINDGEVIVLEGGVRVERHGPQPVLITARRARWLPNQKLLRIDRAPMAADGLHRLGAQRARFFFDRDRLELEGEPRIERWDKPSDPFSRQRRTNPEVVALPQRLFWQPGDGALEAEGPLRIRRLPPGRPPQALPQTLTAAGLNGNTRQQRYQLKGPVQVSDPIEKFELEGQNLQLDGAAQTLSSEQAFSGHWRALTFGGKSLEIEARQTKATIPLGCRLQRSGESLSARLCRWNWQDQTLFAAGDVDYQRAAQRQRIQAGQLSGRLGPEGNFNVSTPGGRVISSFAVPRRQRPLPPAPARPKPEPLHL
jgi:LPS export ABC transporter protein LptC